MKILLGTIEICRHLHDLAAAFRRLGHEAETVVAGINPYYADLRYDYMIQPGILARHPSMLRDIIAPYDVFVFLFGQSLLPGNEDFPIIKAAGKQIVSIFNGSDIRHHSAAGPVAAHYGYRLPQMCYEAPFNDLRARLHPLRMAERWADAVFSLPFQSELALRPYWHFRLPVDLSLYHEVIPARETPLLVHAPSRRGFKGTAEILSALDRLRSEGVRFELRLLEGVPNTEVLRAITEADVVIDELNSPHYAMLALEGMASGCCVVANCDRRYVPAQGEAPVFPAGIADVYERLRLLLTNPEIIHDRAQQGRVFVRDTHSAETVARDMLSKIATPPDLHDYYPTYWAPRAGEEPEDMRGMSQEIRKTYPPGVWEDAEIWGWSPHLERVPA